MEHSDCYGYSPIVFLKIFSVFTLCPESGRRVRVQAFLVDLGPQDDGSEQDALLPVELTGAEGEAVNQIILTQRGGTLSGVVQPRDWGLGDYILKVEEIGTPTEGGSLWQGLSFQIRVTGEGRLRFL